MSPAEKADNLETKSCCVGIPPCRQDRVQIRTAAADLVRLEPLTPPLPLEKLKSFSAVILEHLRLDPSYVPFTVVTLSNELWRATVARIPYNKRLLLLPQCLKNSRHCSAEIDSMGLLCRHCGQCTIDRFTRRAEQLGYAALVAEGSPVVMALIESGQVQATIGVSCLSVLERVFPYMEAGAVPGIAVPLLVDGCRDTVFDEDWLAEALEECDLQASGPSDLTLLRQTVQQWFEPPTIIQFLKPESGSASQLSIDWLCREGKRYRPALTAGIFTALTGLPLHAIPDSVRQASIAVECFHKASLIHDDIEDGDAARYNQPTLHHQHGIAIALNVGDYLIGAGYRLLAEMDCPNEAKIEILRIAAKCHQTLCIGQGEELALIRLKQTPNVEKVLQIFSQKTSPAFNAALQIGAILAQADRQMLHGLDQFSEAVGIGYQIHDDLRDARSGRPDEPLSILAALKQSLPPQSPFHSAEALLDSYRTKAIETLEAVTNADCKAFLRKVVTRLFDQTEPMECCDAPFGEEK